MTYFTRPLKDVSLDLLCGFLSWDIRCRCLCLDKYRSLSLALAICLDPCCFQLPRPCASLQHDLCIFVASQIYHIPAEEDVRQ
jgi:hypothetical protein